MASLVLPNSVSFIGKTAIVTGANAGLGFSASLHLLQRGLNTLVLAVRSPANGEAAKARLLDDPAVKELHPKPQVLVYELDLASLDSVKSFAQKITAEVPQVNVLILNAGVNIMNWTTTSSQNETVFQVNYLSNALLSILLLPILRSSAEASDPPSPSFINIVGSRMHATSSFNGTPIPSSKLVLEHFNSKDAYKGLRRYSDSKLLVTMWVRQLAKHVDPSKVVVNALCPGFVQTDFDTNLPFWIRPIVVGLRKLTARTADLASWVMVYAVGPAGPASHGEFLAENKITPTLPFLQTPIGEEMEKKVWKETLEWSEEIVPGILSNAQMEK